MKKRLFLLLTLLLIIPLTLAITLNEKESITDKGKTITLKSVLSDKAVVDVDGISNIIGLGKTETINGVQITVSSISMEFETGSADLTINILAECGDNNCSKLESYETCCRDCKCPSGLTCLDNQCINSSLNECSTNTNCNDNNNDTLDLCLGIPRKCIFREKNHTCSNAEECEDNDKSTWDICDSEQNICFNIPLESLNECNSDSDCNDNLISTRDRCIDTPKKCENKNITSCESYDNYCPLNCTYPDDLNCKPCETNKNCDDNITCTTDSCNKTCFHEKVIGCVLDDNCMPLNSTSIIENISSYCFNETWTPQLKINSSCSYNFECETNLCNNSICTFSKESKLKIGFFRNIFNFIKKLFTPLF